MKAVQIIKLCRPWQWYKNLVIFLAIMFTSQIFYFDSLVITIQGFISLCFISSANYILNDIIDRKSDRVNPEKKNRPVASGKINVIEAVIIMLLLVISALFIASTLETRFVYVVIFLFIFTQIYSLLLKNEAIIDILCIAILFVSRASSGAYLLNVRISPWLIICTFFIAMFLAVSKRVGELKFLGKNAAKHRKSLKDYSPAFSKSLLIIITTLLLTSYALYSFFSNYNYLIYTIPFAIYAIFRYVGLVFKGSKISRHPELALIDTRLVITIILWSIIILTLTNLI